MSSVVTVKNRAIAVDGYYPLYRTAQEATAAAAVSQGSHSHDIQVSPGMYAGAIAIDGLYPLYATEEEANAISGEGSSTGYEVTGGTYYMPYGLTANWHGDYPGTYSTLSLTGGTYYMPDRFTINGYYPLFYTEAEAKLHSPLETAHLHTFDVNGVDVTYYMPNGLETEKGTGRITEYHGDYVPAIPQYHGNYPNVTSSTTNIDGYMTFQIEPSVIYTNNAGTIVKNPIKYGLTNTLPNTVELSLSLDTNNAPPTVYVHHRYAHAVTGTQEEGIFAVANPEIAGDIATFVWNPRESLGTQVSQPPANGDLSVVNYYVVYSNDATLDISLWKEKIYQKTNISGTWNNTNAASHRLMTANNNITAIPSIPFYTTAMGFGTYMVPQSDNFNSADAPGYFVPPAPVVDFILTGLNAVLDTTEKFILPIVATVGEDLDKFKHQIRITANPADWNAVFWMSPEDSDGPLYSAEALSIIQDFTNDDMKFHTRPNEFTRDMLNYDENTYTLLEPSTNKEGKAPPHTTLEHPSEDLSTQTTSDACIKVWSKNIFNREKMDNIWSNRDKVAEEIAKFIKDDEFPTTGLFALIKQKIAEANALKNSAEGDNRTTKNLTRQLMLQLHESIYDIPEMEYRLLNGPEGIFFPANKEQDVVVDFDGTTETDDYYAFKFIPGDSLSFGLTIRHMDDYDYGTTTTQHGSNNLFNVFNGGLEPVDMKFKVTITMADDGINN